MEDAESKIQRYEKLMPSSEVTTSTDDTGVETLSIESKSDMAPRNSGAVNIEYLKNIMLSFLTAKTLAEKKSLLPVIGAVLCLTQTEQTRALDNLGGDSASLGSVGMSLFESLGYSTT